MGGIGEPKRHIEFEPIPDDVPVEEPLIEPVPEAVPA